MADSTRCGQYRILWPLISPPAVLLWNQIFFAHELRNRGLINNVCEVSLKCLFKIWPQQQRTAGKHSGRVAIHRPRVIIGQPLSEGCLPAEERSIWNLSMPCKISLAQRGVQMRGCSENSLPSPVTLRTTIILLGTYLWKSLECKLCLETRCWRLRLVGKQKHFLSLLGWIRVAFDMGVSGVNHANSVQTIRV